MKKSVFILGNISKSHYLPLYALLLISIIFRFPFVLKGFGETDAANLAVSIIDFINHGGEGFLTGLYFIDVVPLYVVYIKFVMKLLGNNYGYLTTVMNYTNAIAGTLIIIPAYLLVKRLFYNNAIAFYTTLTFIFVPSIYQSSIYGFPHLIALCFFITSLYFFLVWLDDKRYIWLGLSFAALTSTILFKSDFMLGSGAYFGLLCMRKVKEKEKIVLSFFVIILSIAFFLFLRHWMTGMSQGNTASLPNFLEWFKHFSGPLFSKSIFQLIQDQVGPIAYGIGILNCIMAGIVFAFYLVKMKTDVLALILSWTALPTFIWLLLWINSARHNMLSVLPFLMIIFLFIYEKAPKFMALSAMLLIAGNVLVTSPSASTRVPSGSLFKSQGILDSQMNNLHVVAMKIAELDNDKIVFVNESFRPYLYYEIFSLAPEYELIRLEDSCYRINNKMKGCIICVLSMTDPITQINDMISKYNLEKYAFVLPVSLELNYNILKEAGYNIYGYERFKFMGKL